MADERRTANGNQRMGRITLGGVSSPAGIVIAWLLVNAWGKPMTELELIALSSVAGSLTSMMAICFWDLRGILLSLVKHRRVTEGKRRDLPP